MVCGRGESKRTFETSVYSLGRIRLIISRQNRHIIASLLDVPKHFVVAVRVAADVVEWGGFDEEGDFHGRDGG